MTNADVKTTFLDARLTKEVTVYLINGFQVRGTLLAYDESGLVLATKQYNEPYKNTDREVFIPMHGCSTVL